jgi:hypothetical protein
MDSAERTVMWVEHTFQIRSLIYAQVGTTDDTMDGIRHRLTSQGGDFLYSDRGYGQFSVGTQGRMKDVRFGPRVDVLSWQPWGDANAALVEWKCVVSIPECDAARFENALACWNYSVTYDQDADGFTTRRARGHIIIAQTRNGQATRTLKYSADEYREQIRPHCPFGFRPLPSSVTLSEDRNRLDFAYADEEMGPDIPPPGIIRIDAGMEATNTRPAAFGIYSYTLAATYDMARGVSAKVAYDHFMKFKDSRIAVCRAMAALQPVPTTPESPGVVNTGAKTKGELILTGWRVREPRIYGKVKQAAFALTWTMTYPIRSLMAHSFWTPVPDSNYTKWRTSLANTVFAVRGNAGLRYSAKDSDLVIDLCSLGTPGNRPVENPTTGFKLVQSAAPAEFKPEDPTWAMFEQFFWFQRVDSTYVHKPLGEPGNTGTTLKTNFPRPGSEDAYANEAMIVGQRCSPTWMLIHEGRAVRADQTVPPPTVLSIGGVELTPANRPTDGFRQMRVPTADGRLVYAARWRFRYIVKQPFSTDIAPENPIYDETGTATATLKAQRPAIDDGESQTSVLKSGGLGLPF